MLDRYCRNNKPELLTGQDLPAIPVLNEYTLISEKIVVFFSGTLLYFHREISGFNMYSFLLTITFLVVCCGTVPAQPATPGTGDTYRLVWSDEFNYTGSPDSANWRFESGFVRNNEDQWYQKENAVCRDGRLIITGRKEKKTNPLYSKDSRDWKSARKYIRYTSASVVMKKEHAFRYGKVEVRAKLDAQPGLWPAIWTLGVSGEWPSNGEVDLMEYYGDSLLANFAYAGKKRYSAIWDVTKLALEEFGGRSWADQFHVWTLLWDETRMQIFVDDRLLNTISLDTTINKSNGVNPFQQPHYVLLNLAIGGNRGGDPRKTAFPTEYQIDYVRVFQKI